jgi:hypothetical protein
MSRLRRVNYFEGRLLSAADFVAEQDYHRDRARRHNLHLHGSGVVRGLTVSLSGGATLRPAVDVKPGVGIDPAGNELELEAATSVAVPARLGAFVVAIRYAEWPVDPLPVPGTGRETEACQPAFVAEGCELCLLPDDPPGTAAHTALALARFVRAKTGWRRDASFRPRRSR